MCDFNATDPSCGEPGVTPGGNNPGVSRRHLLGAVGVSAAAVTAGGLMGTASPAQAAQTAPAAQDSSALSVALLGTAGGPPPLAARFGISSALVVNGRTYVIDCGRGSVSQFMRAGLPLSSLSGIFLTHLHSDHTVDYFSYPLLSSINPPRFEPVGVYGPGPAGKQSLAPSAPGPVPGTAGLTSLASQAFAASTTFFMAERLCVDPATLVDVHEVMPPSGAGASPGDPAPDTMEPFTVMETDDMKVSAICVPHGAVFPAYAYRFDTDHGSVVFSGDTAPTPNIPRLARHADLLVHEVVDIAAYARLGLPPALLTHIEDVHTDVTKLGGIAAESGVKALAVTHLGPGDPAQVSDAQWRKLLHDSARQADYPGPMILGMDLMRIPVGRRRVRRH